MNEPTSLEGFYQEINATIPDSLNKELGHFNVFDIGSTMARYHGTKQMPYNRRMYYKISWISGHNRAEYADKVIEIHKNALLFATPKVPYHWLPQNMEQSGYFCIFTPEFLSPDKAGAHLDQLPIFRPGGYPIFQLTDEQSVEIGNIMKKMYDVMASDYAYKYDLARNYTMELIHYGQRLQPLEAMPQTHNASTRIASLFIELLERQFPIESPFQKIGLRSAKDYADGLSVHVNHLNKVLKETTGKTTTEIIAARLVKEASILLRQTDWSISEIAFSLDFEEVAHFSNFFKKHTQLTPLSYRNQ